MTADGRLYDAFAAGRSAVGVRTGQVTDARRGRTLPFEVWYPDGALSARCPLILYSHSSYGHRRQSSFLCAHLASHGYVVAAVDHAGNTAAEWPEALAKAPTCTTEERAAQIREMIAGRVPDLLFLRDEVLRADHSASIDPDRLGLCGWSFGGWAVLATPEVDDRFGSIVALAPGGASNPLPGIIPAKLTFAWKRKPPVLVLAAERDQFTPLAGVSEIFARVPSREKRMFVLRDADHAHFADDAPATGPLKETAYLFTRSLVLAHFDASLRALPSAREFLRTDPMSALRVRGVDGFDGALAAQTA